MAGLEGGLGKIRKTSQAAMLGIATIVGAHSQNAEAARQPFTVDETTRAIEDTEARKEYQEQQDELKELNAEFTAFQEMVHHLGSIGEFKGVDPDVHRVVRETINLVGVDALGRRESGVAAIADIERFEGAVAERFKQEFSVERYEQDKDKIHEFAAKISAYAHGFLTGAGEE